MESVKCPKVDADDEPKLDPQTFARSYQLEALEMAIKQNTIVFLETGSGKTLIAVMLLRAFTHEIRKPSDSIAVFLVPTVILVTQQARVLEMHTDLKVGQFYGEMGVDFWDASIWKQQLEQYEDYHQLLKSNSIQLPRIFGMTASLVCTKGSNNRSAYTKQIAEIERLMDSKVYTVASESVLAQYIPFSTPKIKLYTRVDEPFKLFSRLTDLLNDLKRKHLQALQELMLDGQVEESTRKKIEKLHGTLIFCLTELGLWSAVKAAETLSCIENDIPFWGERTDGISEKTSRKFCLDVFKVFSKYLPAGRSIGEDLKEDTASGLLSSKVQCLIKSLLDYRWIIPGNCHNFNVDNQIIFSSQSNVYNIGTSRIKSKVIADSVGALIGAYLSSARELAAFHFLEWLGIKIDFNKETVVERPLLGSFAKFINIKDLEILLDYEFNNPWLLAEALTHGSYQIPDIPRCYQRLEFLGDAVLDYLITVHLYNKYPKMTPGLITDLRSASVNNDCYAHAAAKAGLNKHILHASSELHRQMNFYLENFTPSFSGPSHGWDAGVALPKVLADVIESISGAIYIDSKSNKEIVWNNIRRLLEPVVTPETMELNALRELNDLCYQKSYNMSFSKTCQSGVASIVAVVEANGVVYKGESTGTNKKMAKKLAARDVLRTIKNDILGSNISNICAL